MLSVGGKGEVTKLAGQFTFDEVVQDFGLKYTSDPYDTQQHIWKIEDSELDFTTTPYLIPLIRNYMKIFDRSSEATPASRRTGIGLVLNDCLTVMKGNCLDPAAAMTSDRQRRIPFDDVRVYTKVAFTHTVIPQSETRSTPPTRVSGCLDYGIGRVLNRVDWHHRRFQCFLVIVEAKPHFSVGEGVSELLTYLACLRQSRLERNRSDASVYGICSNGYQFLFTTIQHDGTVKISKIFDILQGELLMVLGWLKYILEQTPDKSGEENDGKDLDDPSLDYINTLQDYSKACYCDEIV